jgi:hypothetical protein
MAPVAIDELPASIHSELDPLRDTGASLLHMSLTYTDPVRLELDPPLQMAPPGAPQTARTLTYRTLYDAVSPTRAR